MTVRFQDLFLELLRFWADRGCVVQMPYDVEKGAGTMNPEPSSVCWARILTLWLMWSPAAAPQTGVTAKIQTGCRKHYQLQVLLKPSPVDIQLTYLQSLERIGIRLVEHDVRFEEDNWESPTLGAWGLGWQVLLDGLEITQFTYFQQAGGLDLDPCSVEVTYGLERIGMFLNDADSCFDLEWSSAHPTVRFDCATRSSFPDITLKRLIQPSTSNGLATLSRRPLASLT